jgi:putative Holliday junction resolvase
MAEASELIGLDIGHKRTGIARASSLAALAEPLMSVGTTEVVKTLKKLASDKEVSAVAIGLPRNLQGNDTAQTLWVRDFVDKLKKQITMPFYWQDEALTTKLAENLKQGAKSPADEHSLAAAIVLQDFLDTPPAERVIC